MAGPETHRSINLSRTSGGRFRATNPRGGVLEFGSGHDDDFTPVELLLTAIGGCSGIDVDLLTSRRAEPNEFSVAVGADTVRDNNIGSHLDSVTVTFSLSFPAGPEGDAARAVLPKAIQQSHDRLCTVSRTVELGTPVHMRAGEA